MERGLQGKHVTSAALGETVRAFVPAPLPPRPGLDWGQGLREKFDEALLALGQLNGVSALVPDMPLFLYMYVRKEAVLSSMIEGTQSSLSDLLLFEMGQEPGVPLDDVREVSAYVAALEHGLRLLDGGLPLSIRLMREVHGVLFAKGRGAGQTPGEFRRSQNWIGGTRPGNAVFVPPPADKVLDCMSDLERFLNDQPAATPALLKAALAHVQFETIHPFLDGNGRVGRLLITLLLRQQLNAPMLYLSLHFKAHRQRYYDLLGRVRLAGDWEAWLDFFAEAVIATATQATATAQELAALTAGDSQRIDRLGRAAASTRQVHRVLLARPLASSRYLAEATRITPATVNRALGHLQRLGIVKEVTQRQRNRLFSYAAYIDIMAREAPPPPSQPPAGAL